MSPRCFGSGSCRKLSLVPIVIPIVITGLPSAEEDPANELERDGDADDCRREGVISSCREGVPPMDVSLEVLRNAPLSMSLDSFVKVLDV